MGGSWTGKPTCSESLSRWRGVPVRRTTRISDPANRQRLYEQESLTPKESLRFAASGWFGNRTEILRSAKTSNAGLLPSDVVAPKRRIHSSVPDAAVMLPNEKLKHDA
jgi:hypothetical protein